MIEFPQNPYLGQLWVANNAATYVWLGNRWNSAVALQQGIAEFYIDGGVASTTSFSNTLDGGNAVS